MSHKVMRITVPENIIPETVDFLQKQGQRGFEGRVYWIGIVNGATTRIIRVAIPEQIARKTLYGVSVTVPQQANVKIARELKLGEYIVAKVHSHPGRSYNSDVDRTNPFLRHAGSISIIVPNFGGNGMAQLSNCVVSRFENGAWRELTKPEVASLFQFS